MASERSTVNLCVGFLTARDDIVEAVFRHQIQKHRADVYFLSLESGDDPTDEFMGRFKGNSLIKRVSQSTFGSSYFVMDINSKERGAVLHAGPIKPINDNEVEVYAMISTGRDGSRGYSYHLLHEENQWVVKAEQPISE